MNPDPPERDELEVSVFGRGYGEAVCIHLGADEWILIDSCIDPQTAQPAALTYLNRLGLSPERDVRLVIVTHWDDDHIQGMAKIVEACATARVACSAALSRKDILAFVVEQEAASGALGSGLDEFRTVLRICRDRGKPILWAKANLPLHPLPPGDQPRVIALSPSEDAFERSIETLIEAATNARSTLRRRYRAPEGPNGASIAASVRVGAEAVLAGADLEVSPNAEAGWDAVLAYARPSVKASLVKVPHHGSAGSHHAEMWSELVEEDAVAVVTPWKRGGNYLPKDEDLTRLRSVCGRLFVTATPGFTRVKNDPAIEKLIRRLHGEAVFELTGWGHVRARKRHDHDAWQIALDGDARRVAR